MSVLTYLWITKPSSADDRSIYSCIKQFFKHSHTLFLFRKEYTPSTRKILIKEGNIGLVSSGFEAIRGNRLKYVNNPLIGYLNINSLRNKIVDLREIIL